MRNAKKAAGAASEKAKSEPVQSEDKLNEEVSSEERIKHSFRFHDLEKPDAVNDPVDPIEDVQAGIAKIRARLAAEEEGKKPRTLKELQEAMEQFDAGDLTKMLNSAYGRSS